MKRLHNACLVEEGALYRFTNPPQCSDVNVALVSHLNEIYLTQEVSSFDKGLVTLLSMQKYRYLRIKTKLFTLASFNPIAHSWQYVDLKTSLNLTLLKWMKQT